MIRRTCFGVLLCVFACGVAWPQDKDVEVPFDGAWKPWVSAAAKEKAEKYQYTVTPEGASFRANGAGGVMVWGRAFDPPLNVARMRFLTMRYRLTNTDPGLASYFLYLSENTEGRMYARNLALGAPDLIHDGEWHTATTTLHPYGVIANVGLRFRCLEGKEARVDLAYLRLTRDPPRVPLKTTLNWRPSQEGIRGTPVSLGSAANTPLPDLQKALDLDDWFTSDRISADGVCFIVAASGNVAISTPRKEKKRVTVPIGRQAHALYLLMGAQFPYKMLDYGGWTPGDMTERPEQFVVTIRYADGAEEDQVPFCLDKARRGVWRGVRAYAMPLDPAKPVTEIELWDGMLTSAFHLIAVTAGEKSLAPVEEGGAHHTPPGREPAPVAPSLSGGAGKLLARNSSGELRFDVSKGIALEGALNARHPDWPLSARPHPLFTIKEGYTAWPATAFDTDAPGSVAGSKTVLRFHNKEARVEAELTMEVGNEEVSLLLRVRNLATEARRLDVIFPQIALASGQPQDLWYFYPCMCPAWSNADRAFKTAYGGFFPVQFMDAYDRRVGGGIYLSTRGQSLMQRYFHLAKTEGALTLAVEYEHNPPAPPGLWVDYPPTVIALHGGDWRPAFSAYEGWLKTWYKPQKPRLDWFRRTWNFRTEWMRTMGNGNPEWNFYNPATGEIRAEYFLKKDRESFGNVDYMHFFDWRISEKYGRYGDFNHYDEFWGLDKFCRMIQYLQANGCRVGLYLDTYLCSRKSLIGQKHAEEWALANEAGRLGDAYSTKDDPMYSMCVRHPGWQDYLTQTCARVANETGCDGIYLDEGMTDFPQYWCWREGHGHATPSTNQTGCLEICRKVRAALPDRVALYTEWSPADVIIPHLDGAYMASLRLSDIHVSPGFLQLARFAFPDFKVFTISNGGSMYDGIWEGLKYSLFNGVALYSLSWGHDEDALPYCRKITRILKEHEDAFLTLDPRPFIETEQSGIFCNEFPGPRETVWTFWNQRYRTAAGPMLKVRHADGARYVDLWNEQEITPVVEDGIALISVPLGPRDIGVVAQIRR